MQRKREEYYEIVRNYFGDFTVNSVQNLLQQDRKSMDGSDKSPLKSDDEDATGLAPSKLSSASISLSEFEKKNFKQIKIDVLRTQPSMEAFRAPQVQSMMIRILFIWAVRHPASGYVQGINFLCAPLLLAYASEHVFNADKAEFNLRR